MSSFGPSEQTAAYPKMSTPRAYGGGASSATRSPMIVPRGAAAPRDIDAPFVNSKLQRGRRGNREYARWRVTQGQGTDHHSPVPAHPRSGRLADPNALRSRHSLKKLSRIRVSTIRFVQQVLRAMSPMVAQRVQSHGKATRPGAPLAPPCV